MKFQSLRVDFPNIYTRMAFERLRRHKDSIPHSFAKTLTLNALSIRRIRDVVHELLWTECFVTHAGSQSPAVASIRSRLGNRSPNERAQASPSPVRSDECRGGRTPRVSAAIPWA